MEFDVLIKHSLSLSFSPLTSKSIDLQSLFLTELRVALSRANHIGSHVHSTEPVTVFSICFLVSVIERRGNACVVVVMERRKETETGRGGKWEEKCKKNKRGREMKRKGR